MVLPLLSDCRGRTHYKAGSGCLQSPGAAQMRRSAGGTPDQVPQHRRDLATDQQYPQAQRMAGPTAGSRRRITLLTSQSGGHTEESDHQRLDLPAVGILQDGVLLLSVRSDIARPIDDPVSGYRHVRFTRIDHRRLLGAVALNAAPRYCFHCSLPGSTATSPITQSMLQEKWKLQVGLSLRPCHKADIVWFANFAIRFVDISPCGICGDYFVGTALQRSYCRHTHVVLYVYVANALHHITLLVLISCLSSRCICFDCPVHRQLHDFCTTRLRGHRSWQLPFGWGFLLLWLGGWCMIISIIVVG